MIERTGAWGILRGLGTGKGLSAFTCRSPTIQVFSFGGYSDWGGWVPDDCECFEFEVEERRFICCRDVDPVRLFRFKYSPNSSLGECPSVDIRLLLC